jgi:protein-arginine kinase activator protein McsA
MLCQSCRIREASIHFSEVVSGEQESRDLCAACAASLEYKKGLFSSKQLCDYCGEKAEIYEEGFVNGFISSTDKGTYSCRSCFAKINSDIQLALSKMTSEMSVEQSQEYIGKAVENAQESARKK